MMSYEQFADYVREALDNLYDPGRLQSSPLAECLGCVGEPVEGMATAVREWLRRGVESLKPDATIPLGRREWIGYRLLWRNSVQLRSVPFVCDELGLSRTSFYRFRRQALKDVASFLWAAYQQREKEMPSLEAEPEPRLPGGQAQEEAFRLARESPRSWVPLGAVLAGARRVSQPLLAERGLTLQIHTPAALPLVYGDAAILRQVFLNVLVEGLNLASGHIVELAIDAECTSCREKREVVCRLRGLGLPADRQVQDVDQLPALALSRGLLEVYGGRLWLEWEGPRSPVLVFAIPTQTKIVQVIDDNEDALVLYQRYLHAQGYALRFARSADEFQKNLAEGAPDLVLLDVLMPKQDGWDILSGLKNRPETARIPVVVCSVLSQPSLALALGAAAVLQKPIREETLLATIKQVLDRADSAA